MSEGAVDIENQYYNSKGDAGKSMWKWLVNVQS